MTDEEFAQIYRDMELELISSMKRNLSKHLKEEQKVGFKFAQWQSETLKEMKRFQKENKSIIGDYTKGLDKEVQKILQDELKQGSKNEFKRYKKLLSNRFRESDNLRGSFFKLNDRKLKGLIETVNNDLRSVNSACFRMMNDQYRKTIIKAAMFSNHGVVSPKKAIDMATNDFLNGGINCVEYKNGRRVNIASYSQMAVRTANTRAQLIGEGQFRQEIGEHLVKITSHGGTCKLCSKWEGKILIDDVYSGGSKKDGKYTLLSIAMEQGMFHPNCRHGLPTYYKELDEIYEEIALNDIGSKQYQDDINYCNLQIQKYRRLEMGSLDEENIKKYHNKVLQWKERKPIDFIDRKNNKLINSKLNEYEEKIISEKVENAYIISSNGEVFKIKGNEYMIRIPDWVSQNNAIITHNHPISQTHFSFSVDDIKFFLNGRLKELRGIDEEYQYTIKRTSKTKYDNLELIEHKFNYDYRIEAVELSYLKELDIDKDEYHYIVNKLSKEYNFVYKRVKR